MVEALALDLVLDKLKAERPIRLSRLTKSTLRFPKGPLTADDVVGCEWVESNHGTLVTDYQFRALCLLDDSFHAYRWKKYQDPNVCVFTIEEFKPLFNEIHRAVVYLKSLGSDTHEALVEFLRPKAQQGRKEADEI